MNIGTDVEAVLAKARETYGNKNQILVCIEELNELACVLAKYPRYEDEAEAREKLYDAVVDEVADVVIILEHVTQILDVELDEVSQRIEMKVERLNRWLNKSTSMQQTLEDREVKSVREMREAEDLIACHTCGQTDRQLCKTCFSAEGAEGIKPYWKPKK